MSDAIQFSATGGALDTDSEEEVQETEPVRIADGTSPELIHPAMTYFDLKASYLRNTGFLTSEQTSNLTSNYRRMILKSNPEVESLDGPSEETRRAQECLRKAILCRSVYVDDTWTPGESLPAEYHAGSSYEQENLYSDDFVPASAHQTEMVDGVMKVWTLGDDDSRSYLGKNIPGVDQYYSDLEELMGIVTDGPTKSFSFRRLQLLEAKFDIHCMLNAQLELQQQKAAHHRDFYNVRKIDNHVHHSACMNQKHLLRFIKKKLRTCGDVTSDSYFRQHIQFLMCLF